MIDPKWCNQALVTECLHEYQPVIVAVELENGKRVPVCELCYMAHLRALLTSNVHRGVKIDGGPLPYFTSPVTYPIDFSTRPERKVRRESWLPKL